MRRSRIGPKSHTAATLTSGRNIPASPHNMTFRHRVAIEDSIGRVLYYAAAQAAEALLRAQRAIIHAEDRGKIAALRLVEHQSAASVVDLGLWPGSYGVHRERLVFSHKKHWGEELAA